MTPRKESALRAILIGIAITIGGSVLIAAYNTKENVSDHTADQVRNDANMQRVLDLLCDGHPEKRQCK